MSDKPTLDYYRQALSTVRQQINAFAEQYPQAASHLDLGPAEIEDPHISRLIESFALISGRIDSIVDDCYPRITQAIVNTVYPSYLSHIPSMSVVSFSPYKTLKSSVFIPKKTLLESHSADHAPCHFETGMDTQILPIELSNVTVERKKLTLELSCLDKDKIFSDLDINTIRLYINSDEISSMDLLNLLYKNTGEIYQNGTLSNATIKLVGFDNDQSMLPLQNGDIQAYQALIEFMYFRKKFFFFDITDLDLTQTDNKISIELNFDKNIPKNLLEITKEQLQVNCAPIINLFSKTIEPVSITHLKNEYPLITDKRHSNHHRIHHVSKVKNLESDKELGYQYNYNDEDPNTVKYCIHHHHSELNRYHESPVTLSISDCDEMLSMSAIELEVATYCSNGDLPNQLSWVQQNNHFQFSETNYPIGKIQCLMHPTEVYDSHVDSKHLQQALSLFNQGQLGLYQQATAKNSLIKLLKLYNFSNNPINLAFINSIENVVLKDKSRHINDSLLNPLQYGVEVEITLSDQQMIESGLFLFEKILSKLYQYHAAINSFVDIKLLLNNGDKQ